LLRIERERHRMRLVRCPAAPCYDADVSRQRTSRDVPRGRSC
jgi:hypothetical protein